MEEVAYRLESALQDQETENPSDVFDSLLEDDSVTVAIDSSATVSREVNGSRYGVEFYDVRVGAEIAQSARVAMVFDEERTYQGGWIDYDASTLEPVEWEEEPLRLVVS
ncbi:MAG: hypothetical protein ABEJ91_02160 [Candidatus Nanohaloarchaea archaeon]